MSFPWTRRSSQRLKDTLDGVPLEKFRRIVGLFNAVVAEELKTKKGEDALNHQNNAEFHKLQSLINKNLEEVKKQPSQNKRSIAEKEHAEEVADEIADQIHNLNLLLGALLPADVLQYALPGYRDDYRGRVSAALYVGYESSPTYKALSSCNGELDSPDKLRLLRADYIH